MRDTIDMAGETLDRMAPDDYCRAPYWTATDEELARFEALVRADERVQERKKWMQIFTDPENQPSQFGTVTVEFMQSEIKAEREACAKVCEEYDDEYDVHTKQTSKGIALEIRARGNT
jgi:hypothetical protein